MERTVTVAAVLAAVVLAAFSTVGEVAAMMAAAAATLLGLLMALGPTRLGTGLVLGGVLLAPMNDLIVGGGSTTVSDLLLAAGFVLLLPQLLEGRTRVPLLFAIGSVGLLVTCVAASMVAPDSSTSLALSLRLIIAMCLMPLAFLLWRPDRRLLRALAWAYVVGQVVNTGVAVLEGGGRIAGATVHPNALAIDGLIASALLIYLWHEVDRAGRWLVVGAAAVCVYSILASGSRGALLALVFVALLYPVVERSATSVMAVVAAVLVSLPLVTWLAGRADEQSALGRLFSEDKSVSGSDSVRREQIAHALDRFFDSPVLGNGFNADLLHPHNILLQLAVAAGVLGLASYLLLMSSFVTVLASNAPDRRLGYVTLAYLAVGMTQPSLWDRNIWAALCLVLVATAWAPEDDEEEPDTQEAPRTGVREASQVSRLRG